MPEKFSSKEEYEEFQAFNQEDNYIRRLGLAEIHNKSRKRYQKILGLDKKSEVSIAQEEAIHDDEVIKKLIESGKAGNTKEAIEIINDYSDDYIEWYKSLKKK